MGPYEVILSGRARKSLDKMSDAILQPILADIEALSENPRPVGCKKLKGRSGYRIRVGAYRVLYEITDKILLVEVTDAGHRKNIYE